MENGHAPLRVLVYADEGTTRRRIVRLLDDLPGVVVVGHASAAPGALCDGRARTADVALVDAAASRAVAAPCDEPAAAPTPGGEPPERFVVRDGRRRHAVVPAEILWVESYGNYTRIVTESRQYLHRATMTETARQLEAAGFARVHRRVVLNAARIVRLRPCGNGQDEARLDTGHRIRVSRSYRAALRRLLAWDEPREPAAATRSGRSAPPHPFNGMPPRVAGRPGSRTSARTVPSR